MLADDVKFCPRCGTGLFQQDRMGKLRPVCPSCDWIFFPDPKVAAAVVVQRLGDVLLVRRAYNPKKGFWTLPVGFVDAGEHPAQAAERECREETGLNIQVVSLLDIFSGQEHPRGAHILIIYRGDIIDGDLCAGDDVDKVGFYPIDSLPPLAFKTTQMIFDRFYNNTW
jgi:ADP-ribose pyrophosphatase YjhB (NUDIX family)